MEMQTICLVQTSEDLQDYCCTDNGCRETSFYCQESICSGPSLGISPQQFCFFCLTGMLGKHPSIGAEIGAKLRTKFRDLTPDFSQAVTLDSQISQSQETLSMMHFRSRF